MSEFYFDNLSFNRRTYIKFDDFGPNFGDLWVLDLYLDGEPENGWTWDEYRDQVVLQDI